MAPVAPSQDNTLTLPVRRLPLGVPMPTDVGPTKWKARIPSSLGGILKVTQGSATQIDIQQPLGTSIGSGTTEASAVVAFGDCFVVLAGGSGMVNAELTQTGWSRMADGDPAVLLPWNFYYWPSAQGAPEAAEARAILKRYASAIGNTTVAADDWEFNNHEFPGAAGWAGHCHNAAPASVLFELPQATTIGGQAFTVEQMKFLATERFGNFGVVAQADWSLRNTKLAGVIARWDILGYFKPGGPKDRATLIDALNSELKNRTLAVQAADTWINAGGGEPALSDWIKKDMGKNAASFFDKLQTVLAMTGAPFTSNLRSYGTGGPEEVWNQIIFFYKATFTETWPQSPQDDHDIHVSCDVYSNIDDRSAPDAPATVSGVVVTPGTSSTDCWVYKNKWRLVFDDNGKVNAGDARSDWISLQDDGGDELYAPTNLNQLQTPLTTPRQGVAPVMLGNPAVGAEFLGYAKINARYK